MTSLYLGKSTLFKSFMLLGVLLISVVFIGYTFSVIDKLQADARYQVEIYVRLWQFAANSEDSGGELQFIFNEIIQKATFPILVADADGEPQNWRNIPDIEPTDNSPEALAKLKKIAEEMGEAHGRFPLFYRNDFVNYLYYGDSDLILQLKMMPFIQIGIVVAFMLVGLIGFQNIRRSEERHIWVGMAKETAHQLGTPISSLLGWLEVLESECPGGPAKSDVQRLIAETTDNMKVDVTRLQKVANRFGMIGSIPELHPTSVNDVLMEVVEYYRRRLPFEGQGIRIDFVPDVVPQVPLNPELFSWSIENLLKNALQAVDSKTGRIDISTRLLEGKHTVEILIRDNGKGISVAAARKIFQAGFTTKKRGWGLGLTLVKRIIEEYHGGQIRLSHSRPGETEFVIHVPSSTRK
jgi:hypothetical protein